MTAVGGAEVKFHDLALVVEDMVLAGESWKGHLLYDSKTEVIHMKQNWCY
jgi:hypothetical protein